jgi:ELWxxDGT repeat protein
MVEDILPGPDGSSPEALTVFDNKIYFRASDRENGPELWVYDGVSPPEMVEDILPGPDGSSPEALTVFQNKAHFRTKNKESGNKLTNHIYADGTYTLSDLFISGWENGEPHGHVNQIEYYHNVAGYYDNWNPPPECGRRYHETWRTGNYSLMIAGYSRASYSYCYYRVFDNNIYVTKGLKIGYWIYHYKGTYKVSVDGHFTDGTTLRDFYNNGFITDQHGVRIHPAARRDPMKQWYYVEVDLSRAAGKTIDFLMFAFDNGNDGFTGQYRAYIDDLKIFKEESPECSFRFSPETAIRPGQTFYTYVTANRPYAYVHLIFNGSENKEGVYQWVRDNHNGTWTWKFKVNGLTGGKYYVAYKAGKYGDDYRIHVGDTNISVRIKLGINPTYSNLLIPFLSGREFDDGFDLDMFNYAKQTNADIVRIGFDWSNI